MTKNKINLQKTSQVKEYQSAYKKGQSVRHVVKHEGGWAVKKSGSTRATKVFSKQSSAIVEAKRYAKNDSSAIVVHGKNGKIRQVHRY